MPAARLSNRDYHDALALVSEAAAADGTQPFERSAIESLLQVIPADRAGYFEYNNGGEAFGTANTFFVDAPSCGCIPADWAVDAIAETVGSWPLRDTFDCDRSPVALSRPPLKLSDFVTRRQLRRNPWYCEVMRPSGIEHELKFWLSAPAGTCRGFFLVRGPRERDFDERDRSVLELLQPHLLNIRERWERRRRPSSLTDRRHRSSASWRLVSRTARLPSASSSHVRRSERTSRTSSGSSTCIRGQPPLPASGSSQRTPDVTGSPVHLYAERGSARGGG